MKIALLGHGAMGRLIERLAPENNHEIAVVIDAADSVLTPADLAAKINAVDVAIDFTVAGAVKRNVEACVLARVPLVEGTTGWNHDAENVKKIVADHNGALVYGANFSIGVNLFYRIADFAAALFAKFGEYEPFIEEQHHSRKRDAPSGTALRLKSIIGEHINQDFSIAATRAGHIPGTHRVGFDAAADQILLSHAARSREGFAAGALLAAGWIIGKTGVYEFSEVVSEILEK